MATPRITLYVDTVSPFAYMAYYMLRNDAVFKKCDITYVPIFLGGLMKSCGNTAPLNITNKNVWIDKDRRLWARTLNIPIKEETPANFPPLTLAVMRHLAALSELDGHNQGRLLQALDALYEGFWVRHEATFKPEVFQPILQKILGPDDAARVFDAAGKEGKAALTRNTEQAFDEKAFGLPWMVCRNSKGETESFWGVDHLGQVAAFLGLEKPGSGGWKALL